MKKILTLSLFAFLSTFSIAILAENQANSADQTTASSPLEAKKDGVILQTIMNIDNNEINDAQLAVKKSNNEAVKSFAQTMITEHSKNLQDAKDLSDKIKISPVSTEKTNRLQEMGQKELKKLDATDVKNFDTVYIDAMVKDHELALKIIDDKLIPKASNQDLVVFLKATKEAVTHHLQMAKDVQKSLK